jgi:hypothetical protein
MAILEDGDLNLREQIARIDQIQASIQSTQTDVLRKRQEIAFAPWQFMLAAITTAISLMAAGAGLFAAGAVFVKLI